MMREFRASLDTVAKVLSVIAVAVMAVGLWASQSWIVAALSFLVLLTAYGYSPQSYVIGRRSIIVKRLLKDAEFPLERLQAVRRATPDDLAWTMRLWGSGGLFGYYGTFRTSKLGKCTWYCTRRADQVVVATDSRTALFTPDDVDGFLSAIQAGAPSLGYQAGNPPPIRKQGLGAYGWIIAALALPALLIAIAAVSYSPGMPDVRLNRDSLEISDRFYPVTIARSSVDLDAARPVSINDPEWRVTRRANGFANSHYRSGWYRTANGKEVRLYCAIGQELLLLPGKNGGDTVLLEVPNAAAFLASMRNQWAHSSQ